MSRGGQQHHAPQQQDDRALDSTVRANINRAGEFHGPGARTDHNAYNAQYALMPIPELQIQKVHKLSPSTMVMSVSSGVGFKRLSIDSGPASLRGLLRKSFAVQ
jgi:hypothetical protein